MGNYKRERLLPEVEDLEAGKMRCMNMFQRNGRYEFRTRDGIRQSIVEILEGNPDNL